MAEAPLHHVRIESHKVGYMTRVFVDGVKTDNVIAIKFEASVDDLTVLTLTLLGVDVEIDGTVPMTHGRAAR